MIIEEPKICSGCGIVQVDGANACKTCETTYGELRAVDQPGHGFWVGVQAHFTCNACRFDSPLNHFELGDGVQCTRCGLEQKYEQNRWRDMGELAHEVGDFGSGGPQGRFPDDEVEIDNPFAYLRGHGAWAKRKYFQAAPGNPLCRSCRAPMAFVRRDGDETEVKCSGCAETRRYEFPDTAKRIKHLVAVLADEHEAGRSEVVVREDIGVVALACPSCGGPLENVGGADGIIVCGYCQANCRISTHTHARAGHRDTPAKTWWLYFDQPSSERKKRINQARQRRARAEKKRKKQEHRERSMAGQAPPKAAPTPPPFDADAVAKKAEKRALMPLLLVLLAIPVGVLVVLKPWQSSSGAEPSREQLAAEEKLKDFSFDMSASETGQLFGVAPSDDMTVKFERAGVIRHIRITRSNGPTPAYGIDLTGGDAFDVDAAKRRLEELFPNRLKVSTTTEVNANKSHLRYDGRIFPQRRGRVEVATWLRDDAEARKQANAFWAAAKYVIWGGDKPSDADLRAGNGPQLSTLAGIDVSVSVEKATAAVKEVAPADCKTVQDMTTRRTEVQCTTEVDHPLFDKLQLAWVNAAASRVSYLRLFYRKTEKLVVKDVVARCLEGTLGKAETVVTDHAQGTGYLAYPLGGDTKDRLVLADHLMGFDRGRPATKDEPNDTDETKLPKWAERYEAVMKTLVTCKP